MMLGTTNGHNDPHAATPRRRLALLRLARSAARSSIDGRATEMKEVSCSLLRATKETRWIHAKYGETLQYVHRCDATRRIWDTGYESTGDCKSKYCGLLIYEVRYACVDGWGVSMMMRC